MVFAWRPTCETHPLVGRRRERREAAADDLRALQDVLGTLKALDPNRKRITLVPGPTTTQQVVAWMDAVKVGPRGELFPEVVLQSLAGAAP